MGALSIVLTISGIFWWAKHPVNQPESVTDKPAAQEKSLPTPISIEAHWLFTGEVFWARQMEVIAKTKADPYAYLFSQLKTFNRDNYDAWVSQLECPIANKVIPFSVQVESLIFNCSPEYLPEFAKWFNVASLSNNHMDNVDGTVGLEQTRNNLAKNNVQYYGHYDNSVKDDICEIISLPVRIIYDDKSVTSADFPVAMCGYHGVYRLPTEDELDVIKRFSPRFLTITSPHQGAEYEATADELKMQTYRGMVDRGADLVVASHPHWVQNTEVYKNKLIMYSVGNFMFDQEWSADVKRGVVLDVNLQIDYDSNLDRWLNLAKTCTKFKDDCLSEVNQQDLSKPNINLTYDLISSFHENALTSLAPDNIHKLNLVRTNWAQTQKLLDSAN